VNNVIENQFLICVETIKHAGWFVDWLVCLRGWPPGEYNLCMGKHTGDDSLEFS